MTPFTDYCQRHGLNPDTAEAREHYQAYQRQLELFRSAAGLGASDEPQVHSFPCGLGDVTICRVGDNRFTVKDTRLTLFAMCEREHFTVERWNDAPRLAWFVGVELKEGDE
ncbi:hypothetical protein [Oceanimonas smirnovii]|uniref:Uncharacterized protein n=1 Tax=Oceanimonas smirnovii TaxID=264574 RepID=A0ABW7P4B5_9GAMM